MSDMNTGAAAPQDERAIVLPKIPDPCGKIGLGPGVGYVWDQHQVEDYARAAVLADRAALPAQAVASDHTDYLGHALELESAAKTVESQTVERAMLAGAHCLRIAQAAALAAPVQDVAPSAQQASELAADILIQLANEAPINGNNLAQRRVLWSAAQLRSAATPAVAKDVAPTDDRFDAETWAELHRLREEIKGPPGYATWKDAAVAERLARVRAEGAASPAVAKDVAPSDAQTAPAAKPAGPAGSDALEPFRKLLAAWDGQGAALPPGAHLLMQMNHAATELRDALAHAERAS